MHNDTTNAAYEDCGDDKHQENRSDDDADIYVNLIMVTAAVGAMSTGGQK